MIDPTFFKVVFKSNLISGLACAPLRKDVVRPGAVGSGLCQSFSGNDLTLFQGLHGESDCIFKFVLMKRP